MFLGKWKSHTRMAQPSEKFRWKKSMACPCFLHRVFSKAVQPSMKVVVEVYINDFFLAVEYANKMVRQIKEWCFFWSVSLQPTKRSTFPHAVLLRHERVACHCFMSFGLCDKNGTASCGYKSQPLSARQTKKSPWQYSLEVFQGIPPRIFLAVPLSEEVSLRYEDCLSATTADFYTKHTKGWEYANEIDHSKNRNPCHISLNGLKWKWQRIGFNKNRFTQAKNRG